MFGFSVWVVVVVLVWILCDELNWCSKLLFSIIKVVGVVMISSMVDVVSVVI